MKLNLEYTVDLMKSDDYKDRFKAEYLQTLYRFSKLSNILNDWEKWSKDAELKTPYPILENQFHQMLDYLSTLTLRAQFEGIDLSEEVEFGLKN